MRRMERKAQMAQQVQETVKVAVERNITIYTDGSCLGNGTANARGGWAAILSCEELNYSKELSGAVPGTTNNRMELTAVVEGLKAIKGQHNVTVYSDSAYVVNAVQNGWIDKWQKNCWINSQRKPVENRDLWEAFISLSDEKCASIKMVHVRGHADNGMNNRCDALAVAAANTL